MAEIEGRIKPPQERVNATDILCFHPHSIIYIRVGITLQLNLALCRFPHNEHQKVR
jgi:hypothetical protein